MVLKDAIIKGSVSSDRFQLCLAACRYELVHLLLSYGAEVNCYFRVISDTVFPTALQYSLKDRVMLRLLLNRGYQAHKYIVKRVK